MPNAYLTLLFSASYIPGALVLASSLKKHNSTAGKIVCLVPKDKLFTAHQQNLLLSVFDELIEVDVYGQLSAPDLANLTELTRRPELVHTLAKVQVFGLHDRFDQILYLDADTLVLQNLDHLFSSSPSISDTEIYAAPDCGWPDIFNTGVFLVKPSQRAYEQLRNIIANAWQTNTSSSFDGADQGLLNEFFTENGKFNQGSGGEKRKWRRLSFLYNVTPTGHYQYNPAFNRFFPSIKIVHYIGPSKPWSNLVTYWDVEILTDKKNGNGNNIVTSKGSYEELNKLWWSQWYSHFGQDSDIKSICSLNELIQFPKDFKYGKFESNKNFVDAINNEQHFDRSKLDYNANQYDYNYNTAKNLDTNAAEELHLPIPLISREEFEKRVKLLEEQEKLAKEREKAYSNEGNILQKSRNDHGNNSNASYSSVNATSSLPVPDSVISVEDLRNAYNNATAINAAAINSATASAATVASDSAISGYLTTKSENNHVADITNKDNRISNISIETSSASASSNKPNSSLSFMFRNDFQAERQFNDYDDKKKTFSNNHTTDVTSLQRKGDSNISQQQQQSKVEVPELQFWNAHSDILPERKFLSDEDINGGNRSKKFQFPNPLSSLNPQQPHSHHRNITAIGATSISKDQIMSFLTDPQTYSRFKTIEPSNVWDPSTQDPSCLKNHQPEAINFRFVSGSGSNSQNRGYHASNQSGGFRGAPLVKRRGAGIGQGQGGININFELNKQHNEKIVKLYNEALEEAKREEEARREKERDEWLRKEKEAKEEWLRKEKEAKDEWIRKEKEAKDEWIRKEKEANLVRKAREKEEWLKKEKEAKEAKEAEQMFKQERKDKEEWLKKERIANDEWLKKEKEAKDFEERRNREQREKEEWIAKEKLAKDEWLRKEREAKEAKEAEEKRKRDQQEKEEWLRKEKEAKDRKEAEQRQAKEHEEWLRKEREARDRRAKDHMEWLRKDEEANDKDVKEWLKNEILAKQKNAEIQAEEALDLKEDNVISAIVSKDIGKPLFDELEPELAKINEDIRELQHQSQDDSQHVYQQNSDSHFTHHGQHEEVAPTRVFNDPSSFTNGSSLSNNKSDFNTIDAEFDFSMHQWSQNSKFRKLFNYSLLPKNQASPEKTKKKLKNKNKSRVKEQSTHNSADDSNKKTSPHNNQKYKAPLKSIMKRTSFEDISPLLDSALEEAKNRSPFSRSSPSSSTSSLPLKSPPRRRSDDWINRETSQVMENIDKIKRGSGEIITSVGKGSKGDDDSSQDVSNLLLESQSRNVLDNELRTAKKTGIQERGGRTNDEENGDQDSLSVRAGPSSKA